MKKLIVMEGCFKPVRCPFIESKFIRPYTIYVCNHPNLPKSNLNLQIPKEGFLDCCPLSSIIEK